MKTTITAVAINVVLLTAITNTTMAQRYYNNNQNNNNAGHSQNSSNNNYHNNGNNDNHQYQGSYGVYNGGTNSYPTYNGGGVYTNYPIVNINLGNNPWYYKNEAKNVLRASKYSINQAQNISYYNANYTPLLALAMRHHQYAKQLYYRANYAAAINHAQRANGLAQDAMYELTAYNYNDNWNNNDDDGFRKNNTSNANTTQQRAVAPAATTPQAKPIQYTSLDNELPASTITDNDRVARKME
ncbi:MAG: hypothetical protein ABL940_06015 [Bacteroidia bacterium]